MEQTKHTPNKYRTASGRLTAYALACGYKEQTERRELGAMLYREHNAYTVCGWKEDGTRVDWCGHSLVEARRVLRSCGPLQYVPTT
jgi:hypothetical protein